MTGGSLSRQTGEELANARGAESYTVQLFGVVTPATISVAYQQAEKPADWADTEITGFLVNGDRVEISFDPDGKTEARVISGETPIGPWTRTNNVTPFGNPVEIGIGDDEDSRFYYLQTK